MIGDDLGWQYYAYGGAVSGPGITSSGSFVDTGSGVGGTFFETIVPITYFNVDATNTAIIFDYSVNTEPGQSWGASSLSLSPTIYNGIAINMLSAGSFTGVTIDPATNMAGFNSSDVSFTSSQIQVNWAGLSFTTSTIVELDVGATASSVPEPGTWSMTLTGLIGCGLVLRWVRGRL